MTLDELRAQHKTAYNIVARERRWREHVFPEGHPKREEKLREMDRMLEIITGWKDELKKRIEAQPEQGVLIDVPRKASYQ